VILGATSVIGLYKVLLIPAQDYSRHPHITRHHHIFENFDDRFRITILNVRLRTGPERRETKHEIIEVGVPTQSVLLSYILGYISFHLQFARLVKANNYDCIVLSNIISPLIPMLARGRAIMFDYKDVYSLSASQPFKTPFRQLMYWLARFFEQILFGYQMTVVVPSPSMQRLVRDRFKIKSVLISNGVNTELFHPISVSTRVKVRAELGVRHDEFCLCYLGSIENWLELETVVQALVRLKSVRLVMIGGPPRSGAYLNTILNLCDREGVRERVTLTGFKDQPEAAKILAACDAAIIPFHVNSELCAVALPDKIFEYLATGIPVISTRLPDVEKLLGNFVYFYNTTDELNNILRHLCSSTSRKCSRSHQVNDMGKYDWKAISTTYQGLLSKVARSDEQPSGQN
jgi:glycosyltransferase involved in cell wall biosynthesis